jgi:hypothetical protein
VPTDIHGLFAMLEAARLRYVLVGGLALVLHGVDRLTADVDLAVDLTPEEALKLIETLDGAGYRPAVPVDPRQLADPATRELWYRERNMRVFSYWDSTGTRPTVDIFIASPIPFEELWQHAVRIEIGAELRVTVASVAHLIRLKALAGRPQDLSDIERLRAIQEVQGS